MECVKSKVEMIGCHIWNDEQEKNAKAKKKILYIITKYN